MRPAHRVVPRGLLDLPTVVLAAAWIGLWLLWPAAPPASPGRSGHRAPTAVFSLLDQPAEHMFLKPDLFGRPSQVGFAASAPPDESLRLFAPAALQKPKILEWDGRPAAPAAAPAGPSPAAPEPGQDGYRPSWAEAPAFVRPVADQMQALTEISPALAARGFRTGPLPAEGVRRTGKPWMAVLYVETRLDGGVAHALVEQSSGDAAVDGMLVRAVSAGRTAEPGPECRGQVTVSFGRR